MSLPRRASRKARKPLFMSSFCGNACRVSVSVRMRAARAFAQHAVRTRASGGAVRKGGGAEGRGAPCSSSRRGSARRTCCPPLLHGGSGGGVAAVGARRCGRGVADRGGGGMARWGGSHGGGAAQPRAIYARGGEAEVLEACLHGTYTRTHACAHVVRVCVPCETAWQSSHLLLQ